LRFFSLLAGSTAITLSEDPLRLKLPMGDALLSGKGVCATLQISSEEGTGEKGVQITNLIDETKPGNKAALRVFIADKQLEVGPGKSLRLTAGSLENIASGADLVLPKENGDAEQITDTYQYHLGSEGSLQVRFPGSQRFIASQQADCTLALDRSHGHIKGLVSLKAGFFKARLKGQNFRVKTPSNRIVLNGAVFWTRIDPNGEWDRIQHVSGVGLKVESLKIEGFSINVPVKGGADLIHPKDTTVVLMSVHKGLPPPRPIIIRFGGRVYELPPEGELKPQPEETMHPEKKGEVLLSEGAVEIMIFREGRPLSYRFMVDEQDLIIPRGDAFKDAGDVRDVGEASPFLK
jgi:hypothetical protein